MGIATAIAVLSNLPGYAQRGRPNVLLIVADDLGYADLGLYGSKDIPTPNIDGIANAGVRFTNAYVSGPYCSPTRAGLMTGKYPQRFGYEFQPEGALSLDGTTEFGLPVNEATMADWLKAAGYRTALFGKWHLGSASQFHPMRRGFDEFFGFLGGQHSYMDVAIDSADPLLEGLKPAQSVDYLTDALGEHAARFINRHASEPFFMYLAFNAGHTPMQAPDKYLNRFANIQNSQRRTYAAMVSAMDDAVGKTLSALRERKLEDRTLVIFLNDNGGPTMRGTTVNGSDNGPLRGSKRQTWEGGIRVAYEFAWKGHIAPGRVIDAPIIQLDVMPTVLAAAGMPVPSAAFDGVNLLPWLTGTPTGPPHEALFWRFGGMMAVRKGEWKLVKTREGPLVDVDPSVLSDLSEAGLYNLNDDIGEAHNRAAEFPDKVKELGTLWQQWNRYLKTPLWAPKPGFGGGN